jgi:hypothetical protein
LVPETSRRAAACKAATKLATWRAPSTRWPSA